MLTLIRAGLLQIIKIKKIINSHKIINANFYSSFRGNLLYQLLKGDIYLIYANEDIIGLIIIDDYKKEVYYIPSKKISIYKLLLTLNKNFNLSGYKISLNYKKINVSDLKKYFSIDVTSNMMFMNIKNDIVIEAMDKNQKLNIRNLKINNEEALRVELQNKVFDNIKNRSALTVNEVVFEERSSKFMKDFCFILEVNGIPAGYGQIMKSNSQYYLVNFGLLKEFRNNGYGYYFLNNILLKCRYNDINPLCLSVDKDNFNAIKLYKKIGFNEFNNVISFIFK